MNRPPGLDTLRWLSARLEASPLPSARLSFVDSLRGLAAIYVILYHVHASPNPQPPISSRALACLIDFGGTGVVLFFVISGFSLAMTMHRHDRTEEPAASYGLSRFFRIAPLFYVVLAIAVAQELVIAERRVAWSTLLLNATFLFNLVPGRQNGIVWASWTIGVEMMFYVVFLPLYRRSIGLQAAVVAVALAVLGLLLAPEYAIRSFIGYVPAFVIGMWSFHAYSKLSGARLGAVLVALGLLTLAGCIWSVPALLLSRVAVPIAYAALLVGCGLIGALSSPILTFFGRISYSLYLSHPLVIFLYFGALDYVVELVPVQLAYVVDVVIVLATSTCLSWGLYEWVERPGIRIGNRVFSWWARRSAHHTSQALSPLRAE